MFLANSFEVCVDVFMNFCFASFVILFNFLSLNSLMIGRTRFFTRYKLLNIILSVDNKGLLWLRHNTFLVLPFSFVFFLYYHKVSVMKAALGFLGSHH